MVLDLVSSEAIRQKGHWISDICAHDLCVYKFQYSILIFRIKQKLVLTYLIWENPEGVYISCEAPLFQNHIFFPNPQRKKQVYFTGFLNPAQISKKFTAAGGGVNEGRDPLQIFLGF